MNPELGDAVRIIASLFVMAFAMVSSRPYN